MIPRYDPIFCKTDSIHIPGTMHESPDGEYYSRADLIAAGVLVPVPDGEACPLAECREPHFFTGDTKTLSCCDEFVVGMYGDQIVRPVRLVKLEDLP